MHPRDQEARAGSEAAAIPAMGEREGSCCRQDGMLRADDRGHKQSLGENHYSKMLCMLNRRHLIHLTPPIKADGFCFPFSTLASKVWAGLTPGFSAEQKDKNPEFLLGLWAACSARRGFHVQSMRVRLGSE